MLATFHFRDQAPDILKREKIMFWITVVPVFVDGHLVSHEWTDHHDSRSLCQQATAYFMASQETEGKAG